MEHEENKGLYIDWVLITAVALISVFGLVMIYSASFVQGYETQGNVSHFFDRQLQWIIVSSILFIFFMFFPYRHFKKLSFFIVLACFIMLGLIFIPTMGVTVGGATRWFSIGGFQIQPSEFVKIGSIIYLAYVYSQKQSYINTLKGVFPPLLIVVILFLLIMRQPDLGTATSIVMVALLIAFCSGARYLHLVSIGSIAVWGLYQYAHSAEYRLNRLIGHRNPFELEATDGYQLVQSYIAISHGGLSGAGLGQSVQKLFYLPEAHTDFILAIISEELGIIGIAFVFTFMLIIITRGIIIGARCKDTFGSLLAFGIVFQLAIQVIFNAGAVSGVLPITGIPFPFLSYGGSSLMVTFISMGILVNISRKVERERKEQLVNEEEYENDETEIPVKTPLRPVR
ncbi:putative lipid II flippase FtsW [Evansella cellulosilytica]|uniref:Probable peptidoglycan glycosyltransferase FtsW n=1 Tax=Evansella cellulosilytica (strain ATCC 21833 / DSM 2522 / FERM P-1141 / JCM 9156 / N-4) TaxID=649639 RepID=E6U1Q1_EVAC2|nr:putative lipid II flippase FtsW [Evansella cellulosilytica]ADU31548.1 cell division protein FtsW [Evansella cellulosilytica DSM 2522]